MDRWACVDAFRFPLQVLLSDHPEWVGHPAAVLDKDHPQGRLTWLSRQARQARLTPGMRYGQALALVPHLRAEAVDDTALGPHADRIARHLQDYSPRVERDNDRPGLFWLDASGLGTLYPDWRTWVEPMRRSLQEELGFHTVVVVGFTRFGTFAVARATGRSGAFATPEDERRDARAVPLAKLDLGPSSLELIRRLGIHTVGDLLALPPESLRRRLGPQVYALYRQARGDLQRPLTSFSDPGDPTAVEHLDHEETNRDRLLFLIKRTLHGLLDRHTDRNEKLTALTLTLSRRDEAPLHAEIQPAEPTTDTVLLLDLVRLRLERLPLTSGITDITLQSRGQRGTTEQLHLFCQAPRRDIHAANRALARVRAEFGDHAVSRVLLHPGHLPERRYELSPLPEISLPTELSDAPDPIAIRRFFPTPIQLPGPPPGTPTGPHVLSGGWWVREVHRDYYLLPTDHRLLWIFFDHPRQRWYLHGEY